MKGRVAVMLGAVLATAGLSMGTTRAATLLLVDDDTVVDGCDAGAAPFGTIQEPWTRPAPATASGSAPAPTRRPSRSMPANAA